MPFAGGEPLDRILRTRGHVRVLRVLASTSPRENLTARGTAAATGLSHPWTARVLWELENVGVVDGLRTGTHGIYRLNERHFLAPSLYALFDDELHVAEQLQADVRSHARQLRRVLAVRVEEGLDGGLEVLVEPRGSSGPIEDALWLGEIERAVRGRFGDVRVTLDDE